MLRKKGCVNSFDSILTPIIIQFVYFFFLFKFMVSQFMKLGKPIILYEATYLNVFHIFQKMKRYLFMFEYLICKK